MHNKEIRFMFLLVEREIPVRLYKNIKDLTIINGVLAGKVYSMLVCRVTTENIFER